MKRNNNPSKKALKMREYRANNPQYRERQKENCKKWRIKNREYGLAYSKAYHAKNREALSLDMRIRQRNLRLEIIEKLGGKCHCCGETKWQFLCLNHKNGGGHQHRLAVNHSRGTIYREVKREGFPKDKYNILCWNCNATIGQFGKCPHKAIDLETLTKMFSIN